MLDCLIGCKGFFKGIRHVQSPQRVTRIHLKDPTFGYRIEGKLGFLYEDPMFHRLLKESRIPLVSSKKGEDDIENNLK